MADIVSKEKRSQMMAGIKSKNTKPEIVIRKLLYSYGYRYRLHPKNIIGKPDIVFRKKKLAVFVNGCFWHGHKDCSIFKMPKTNTEFWKKKIEGNFRRDEMQSKQLIEAGWSVERVWECEIREASKNDKFESILSRIAKHL